MFDILRQFLNRIGQIHSFLDDEEIINELIGNNDIVSGKFKEISNITNLISRLRSNKSDRKVQTYVTCIILLYGLFEQYIEAVLVAYIDVLDSTMSSFNSLPEKIKSNHTNLSAQLLINRDLDKYRDRCNESEIIQRMQSCVDDNQFHLNSLAYTDHRSNFRIESINQFFEPIGISGMSACIKKCTTFRDYYVKAYPGQPLDGMKDNIVFEGLNDLAWRRNIVAHGWPDDTLSNELMIERIELIHIFGQCIFEVLRQNFLKHFVDQKCHPLPKPLMVINNSIICFHLETGTITTGDQIIACRTNGYFMEGKISAIEIEHKNIPLISAPPPNDVACLVDFKAKKNYKYFLANKETIDRSGEQVGRH